MTNKIDADHPMSPPMVTTLKLLAQGPRNVISINPAVLNRLSWLGFAVVSGEATAARIQITEAGQRFLATPS